MRPADFVISEAGLLAVGRTLLDQPARASAGRAVLELAVERSPRSYRARETLAEAYEKAGMTDRAMAEYREAVRLDPQLAKLSMSRLHALR